MALRTGTLGQPTIEPWYAVRWRTADRQSWPHTHRTSLPGVTQYSRTFVEGLVGGQAYEGQVAEIRDPIEIETPDALYWPRALTSTTLTATTLTTLTGLIATATHNAITLSWDNPFAYSNNRSHVYLSFLYHPDHEIARVERVYSNARSFTFDNLQSGAIYRARIEHYGVD